MKDSSKLNEGESNRKLSTMFAGENLQMTQKKLHLFKKRPDVMC